MPEIAATSRAWRSQAARTGSITSASWSPRSRPARPWRSSTRTTRRRRCARCWTTPCRTPTSRTGTASPSAARRDAGGRRDLRAVHLGGRRGGIPPTRSTASRPSRTRAREWTGSTRLEGRPPGGRRPMFFQLDAALAALPELGERTRAAVERLLPGRSPSCCEPGPPLPARLRAGARAPRAARAAARGRLAPLAAVGWPVLQSSANRSGRAGRASPTSTSAYAGCRPRARRGRAAWRAVDGRRPHRL